MINITEEAERQLDLLSERKKEDVFYLFFFYFFKTKSYDSNIIYMI
jgi:hypothetical protein